MGATIKKISYYLPEKTLSNQDLQELVSGMERLLKSRQKLAYEKGILRVITRLPWTWQSKAGSLVLQDYDRDKIDFVLLCTQSPDYFLPTSSCILQERLGLSTRTGAVDYNLGCSGYIYGLALAKEFVNL